MSEFAGAVELLLQGKEVRAALLVSITFNDGHIERLWSGAGEIRIGGNIYRGLPLLSVDGLDAQLGTAAKSASFALSGIDEEVVALAVGEADLIPGSTIDCAIQVFGDGTENGAEWQPIGDPVGLGQWLGDHLAFERSTSTERRVVLFGVSYFESRSRPRASYYSDRDQQQRFPGDRGGQFMAGLTNKTVKWPYDTYT